MTERQLEMIRELQAEGYAVVIFAPEEIPENIDPYDLEGIMISAGHDYICLYDSSEE